VVEQDSSAVPSFVTCSSGKHKRKREYPPLRIRLPPTQKVHPLRIRLPPKKKSPKRVAEKLIVKFPFGKKKSPKKSKKSMMVRIPLEKLRSVTLVKKTTTLADLKLGLAQKKMERAM
jgi:hypothetical protein